MKTTWLLSPILLLLFFSCQESEENVELERITGKIVGVTDGDTVTLLTAEKQQIKIRLSGIDAPEKKQSFGTKAKAALSQKIHGKDVSVRVTGHDRYKRTLGVIFLERENINRWLVASGYAWHYKKYDSSPYLADAEEVARSNRVGLWANQDDLIPPWEYRKRKRGKVK